VGVDRSRRDVGVAEQDLDDPGIDAAFEKPGCIAVPQRMGRDPVRNTGSPDRGPEGAAHNMLCDRLGPGMIGEEPARVAVCSPEGAQVVKNRLWQRHPPFLIAFADDAQDPVGTINRRDLQGRSLADAQATGVHDGQTRLVDRVLYAVQQSADLGVRQDNRQAFLPGRPNLFFQNSGQSRSSVRR